jgi:iron complex outermembrane receptor protein
MVPGFHVSHWTTGAWDVTSRGFGPGLSLTNSAYLNQLLVLIDGVVVYSPLFAGTWWPLQDIDLNDVDRIEIMRGPGGSLWGTNATHGVVNVITKSAAATQGARVSLRNGIDDDHAALRYGGVFGETGSYRVWTKGAWYDTLANPFLGFDADWDIVSAGMRADWQDGDHQFRLWTRVYDSSNEAIGIDPVAGTIPVTDEKHGVQVFGGVTNAEKRSTLQGWFTSDVQDLPTLLDHHIDTLDLEYHRDFPLSPNSTLTLGAGYRRIHSELIGADPTFEDFNPNTFRQDIFRGYAVERLALPGIDSELTLGLTLEHNDFTQFEVQPTLRMTWNAASDVMLWTAVSRAVRTPSLEERTLSGGSFFSGSNDFRSETLIAYELGARALLSPSASADLALFYNDYEHLHFEDFDGVSQFDLTNDAEGSAYGAELALDLKPTEAWTVRGAYSYLRGEYRSTQDGSHLGTDDYYPEQQFNLRSYYDLAPKWELDGALYLVDGLGSDFEIAEYVRADVRLGWHPRPDFRAYAGVQQLNESTHSEFDENDLVRRSVFVGLDWMPGAD